MKLEETSEVFQDLCKREPKIAGLFREAQELQDDKKAKIFCGNAPWYGWGKYPGIKPRLVRLVGWNAKSEDPALHTHTAYDVAYQTLSNLMPCCRGACGCF